MKTLICLLFMIAVGLAQKPSISNYAYPPATGGGGSGCGNSVTCDSVNSTGLITTQDGVNSAGGIEATYDNSMGLFFEEQSLGISASNTGGYVYLSSNAIAEDSLYVSNSGITSLDDGYSGIAFIPDDEGADEYFYSGNSLWAWYGNDGVLNASMNNGAFSAASLTAQNTVSAAGGLTELFADGSLQAGNGGVFTMDATGLIHLVSSSESVNGNIQIDNMASFGLVPVYADNSGLLNPQPALAIPNPSCGAGLPICSNGSNWVCGSNVAGVAHCP